MNARWLLVAGLVGAGAALVSLALSGAPGGEDEFDGAGPGGEAASSAGGSSSERGAGAERGDLRAAPVAPLERIGVWSEADRALEQRPPVEGLATRVWQATEGESGAVPGRHVLELLAADFYVRAASRAELGALEAVTLALPVGQDLRLLEICGALQAAGFGGHVRPRGPLLRFARLTPEELARYRAQAPGTAGSSAWSLQGAGAAMNRPPNAPQRPSPAARGERPRAPRREEQPQDGRR